MTGNLTAAAPSERSRGGTLDARTFARITALAEAKAGLHIPETKFSMVEARMNRRLRATGLSSFGDYMDLVEGPQGGEERGQMLSALTTNVSHFFREQHHFDTLRSEAMPGLAARLQAGGPIRIWSAGCSTGQEPYSIAITLLAADPAIDQKDVKILATDLDQNVLSVAKAGIYDERQMETVPDAVRARHFRKGVAPGTWEVAPSLRGLLTFRPLNLINPWPMRAPFDVIFCRNVLIYFAEGTQRALWPRFEQTLRPGGWLFLGHSERVHDTERANFVSAGITTYRRTATARAPGSKGD